MSERNEPVITDACHACGRPVFPDERTVKSDLNGSRIHSICPIFSPPRTGVARIQRLRCYSCGTTYAGIAGHLDTACPNCDSDSYIEATS